MEEIDSKNTSSLKLPQMSERQAILYLEKSSSNLKRETRRKKTPLSIKSQRIYSNQKKYLYGS